MAEVNESLDLPVVRRYFKRWVLPMLTLSVLGALGSGALAIADQWQKLERFEQLEARVYNTEINGYTTCMAMKELLERLGPHDAEGKSLGTFKLYSAGAKEECKLPTAQGRAE